MNVNDVIVLLLLAAADICLLIFIRRRRAHYIRMDRMSRSLQLHVKSELATDSAPASRRKWPVRGTLSKTVAPQV